MVAVLSSGSQQRSLGHTQHHDSEEIAHRPTRPPGVRRAAGEWSWRLIAYVPLASAGDRPRKACSRAAPILAAKSRTEDRKGTLRWTRGESRCQRFKRPVSYSRGQWLKYVAAFASKRHANPTVTRSTGQISRHSKQATRAGMHRAHAHSRAWNRPPVGNTISLSLSSPHGFRCVFNVVTYSVPCMYIHGYVHVRPGNPSSSCSDQ